MTISIIRHTKVYNPENICYGQQDIELASSFVSDATHIVSYCQNKSKSIIFSSPSNRCIQLAQLCFPHHTIHIDTRLVEMNFGTWQGKPWKTLEEESRLFYESFTPYTPFPQGESFDDVCQRIQIFFSDIQYLNDTNVILFTHGGTIRACLSYLQHIPMEQACMMPVEFGQIFTHSEL